jgi:hypothetical protein
VFKWILELKRLRIEVKALRREIERNQKGLTDWSHRCLAAERERDQWIAAFDKKVKEHAR